MQGPIANILGLSCKKVLNHQASFFSVAKILVGHDV